MNLEVNIFAYVHGMKFIQKCAKSWVDRNLQSHGGHRDFLVQKHISVKSCMKIRSAVLEIWVKL